MNDRMNVHTWRALQTRGAGMPWQAILIDSPIPIKRAIVGQDAANDPVYGEESWPDE